MMRSCVVPPPVLSVLTQDATQLRLLCQIQIPNLQWIKFKSQSFQEVGNSNSNREFKSCSLAALWLARNARSSGSQDRPR